MNKIKQINDINNKIINYIYIKKKKNKNKIKININNEYRKYLNFYIIYNNCN